MAHLQYMPGDPRLVDQLVYELKSKGIFDQFRKECIADVDTRPAYQNLRQRVENSVSTFLSRQTWQPDMNKNQLREKLRKHILDGNYLEQGVERIVDQVVNPKVATVFIPKVEDLVYTVLGITRKKSPPAETSNGKIEDLLPTDLEAVSPGSVKSNDDKNEEMDVDNNTQDNKMEIDEEKSKLDSKEDSVIFEGDKEDTGDIQLPSNEQNDDIDKSNIPLPSEEIKPENIPSPDTSPLKVELEKIELPKEPIISKDIPLPNDTCKDEKDQYFKPISDDEESSSDSSLRRNMSPLTPIRNFNNENSCDAQQAFENDSTNKNEDKVEPSSFRFKLDAKSSENNSDAVKSDKKEAEHNLAYQFDSQVNINNFNTPLYEDSSNSNNLQIDYESDANSKVNTESKVPENDQNSESSKMDKKDDRKSSHRSSHRSRDSHKHSSSKEKKTDSKHSYSRDSSRHDKNKSSKDEKSKSSDKDKSKDKSDKKDSSRDSRHRSSHKSSHKDSKSHRSSSSNGRHSSKHSDDKKSSSSSSHKNKDKSSGKNSSEKPKDSKSNSHRSDKDRKSSSSSRSDKSNSKSKEDKEKEKKSKKENDDHYSLSGRGNPNRRSTDRDSNDGSTSSKGSQNPSNSKSSNSKKESKSSSKSESTTTSDSTSPSDKENMVKEYGTSKTREALLQKPIVRIERHLEVAVASPPRLPFVPDVTIKKPKFAANLEEAKKFMKMRKFLDEEQRRMNQEAALLLEFQANVRPSMSQVYSSISGPELEFACVHSQEMVVQTNEVNEPVQCDDVNVFNQEQHNNNIKNIVQEHDNNVLDEEHIDKAHYTNNELLTVLNDTMEEGNVDFEMLIDNQQVKSSEVIGNNINVDRPSEEINLNENKVKGVENICNVTNKEEQTKYNTEKDLINEPTKDMKQTENTKIKITKNDTTKELEKREKQNNTKKISDMFEVTIVTEELSESAETLNKAETTRVENDEIETHKVGTIHNVTETVDTKINGEENLYYFGEHEKYNAELERAKFNNFFKEYITKSTTKKLYLINCDSYEENVIREVSKELGDYEIVSYHKNGHLKLPNNNKNVIKNINLCAEISLPDYVNNYDSYNENGYSNQQNNVFSPEKSECSFELSSDYDTKLEEMVNRTSRQEIMEIILGSGIDESPSKMPQIDYLNDSNIDSGYEGLKRKISEISDDAASVNNNRPVLTPNKIRKLSTDQISSTTHENEQIANNKTQNIARSKYLGKARRVGLPRPKRTPLANSPSSDKSVENYEQNTPATPHPAATPNGKIRRSKVPQRYDTSDLYKPKLHYLSRRNQVT